MGKPSLLKRAIVGFLAGQPIGAIIYALFGLINSAAGSTIVEPLVGYAIGAGTALGLQFVYDLKEEEAE